MGKVIILEETTKYPLTLIGERAGVCWGSDITDKEKNRKRGIECIESGHGRTLEFVNVEMILEGYSARVIREWYTHIGGAPTRLQESTRYINFSKGIDMVFPDSILKTGSTDESGGEALQIYADTVSRIEFAYKKLVSLGVPKEDASMLLPLGMATKIVDKRNLRNLIDMSHQRMCSRAYIEYRTLMKDICNALSEISDEWKYIVNQYFHPKCEMLGYCPEKNSCGRKQKCENGRPH